MGIRKKNRPGMLAIGWQVNAALSPKYWLEPASKPGRQQDGDLVLIPAQAMAYHTAIVAQSGSGKSFFLGRLVEEILLQTRARCLILDPNADFRRFSEPADASQWKNARYDQKSGRGLLPDEGTQKAFATRWAAVKKHVAGGPGLSKSDGEQLRIPWPSVSIEFLAEEADPGLRIDLYHCHEFVKMIAAVLELALPRETDATRADHPVASLDLIREARRLLRVVKKAGNRKAALEQEVDPHFKDAATSALRRLIGKVFRPIYTDRAIAAVDFISDEAERYYFGKAYEYAAQRIVQTTVGALQVPKSARAQLDILDIPSFEDTRTAHLALHAVLATEWQVARDNWAEAVKKPKKSDTRVPTFIVVDEAHNLIPLQPRGLAAEKLREQFRTIAAEGRKYGLFLILCTQRPDKIDPFVISECENRAIMRLGSRSVLKVAEELLGLEDVPEIVLRKCLEFELGRGLLVGQWSKDRPQFFYAAMRRTVEGGRSLRDEHWTVSGQTSSTSPSVKPVSTAGTRKKKGPASGPAVPRKTDESKPE